jgi:hypothetical protein
MSMRGHTAVARVTDGATAVVVDCVDATEVVTTVEEFSRRDDSATSPDEQAGATRETKRTSHRKRATVGPTLLGER